MKTAYYFQECPTCGRSLRVRVAYLGKHIVCQHCQARFEACDPSSGEPLPSDSSFAVLQRADELIESVRRRKAESA